MKTIRISDTAPRQLVKMGAAMHDAHPEQGEVWSDDFMAETCILAVILMINMDLNVREGLAIAGSATNSLQASEGK